MAWRLTGEHGEEPGDGVEVGDEADVAQVAAELGVVEGDQLTEHRQVLCNSRRVTNKQSKRHQQPVDASPTNSRRVTNNQSTRHQQPVDASPTTSRRVTSFQ